MLDGSIWNSLFKCTLLILFKPSIFSEEDKYIIYTDEKIGMEIFDLENRKLIEKIEFLKNNKEKFEWSEKGNYLICNTENRIEIWKIKN